MYIHIFFDEKVECISWTSEIEVSYFLNLEYKVFMSSTQAKFFLSSF